MGTGPLEEVAAEFVELGRAIAGRTADGDTRLVVFQTFYNEIAFDSATGKLRSREGQAAQIEPVLERMRVLADAMRAEEWKPERAEFIEFSEWEQGTESRERDAERVIIASEITDRIDAGRTSVKRRAEERQALNMNECVSTRRRRACQPD